jgi:hypothetical protein
VIGVLALLSCGYFERKAAHKGEIGDEEYRVMSALLKEFTTASDTSSLLGKPLCLLESELKGMDSVAISKLEMAHEAREDSLVRKYGLLSLRIPRRPERSTAFYDTLIMRFGRLAFWVLMDSASNKVVFDSLHRKFGNLDYYYTLDDQTHPYSLRETSFDTIQDRRLISPELLRNYNSVNEHGYALDGKKFDDSIAVDFVSGQTKADLQGRPDFRRIFRETYPLSSGFAGVSRVGFNSDKSVAAIFYENRPSWGRAYGSCYLLQKRNGQWEIILEERLWTGPGIL